MLRHRQPNMSSPSAWISPAPAAAVRSVRLRFRAVWALSSGSSGRQRHKDWSKEGVDDEDDPEAVAS
jgi:hypothetical protein